VRLNLSGTDRALKWNYVVVLSKKTFVENVENQLHPLVAEVHFKSK
jgi:hypothetical protein